jgi:hypothetical protein
MIWMEKKSAESSQGVVSNRAPHANPNPKPKALNSLVERCVEACLGGKTTLFDEGLKF